MNYIDSLIRIQNASQRKNSNVILRFSSLTVKILFKLKQHGFISSFYVNENKSIKVILAYEFENNIIKFRKFNKVKFISKPGRKIYKSYDKLYKVLGGYGVLLMSTSKGILTGKECKFQKIGGEILAEIF